MEQDAIYGLLCAVLLLVTAAFLYLYINHKKMCKAVVYLTEKAEQISARRLLMWTNWYVRESLKIFGG